LYRVAVSYVRSEVTAEDVVDGVFARVWERRDALQPETRLGVYLLVAVRRAALDVVRHGATVRRLVVSRGDEVPGMGSAPGLADAMAEHDEVIALVWRAIDALPERARLVMMLRWREQWDWPRVAEALGVSVAAAQMQHTRALKTLREQLPRYLGE
jgi:RNA polymerase sigma-70 factor (ECF subfamily)